MWSSTVGWGMHVSSGIGHDWGSISHRRLASSELLRDKSRLWHTVILIETQAAYAPSFRLISRLPLRSFIPNIQEAVADSDRLRPPRRGRRTPSASSNGSTAGGYVNVRPTGCQLNTKSEASRGCLSATIGVEGVPGSDARGSLKFRRCARSALLRPVSVWRVW